MNISKGKDITLISMSYMTPEIKSIYKTLGENKNYLAGLNIHKGKITFKGVADAFNLQYTPPEKAILE